MHIQLTCVCVCVCVRGKLHFKLSCYSFFLRKPDIHTLSSPRSICTLYPSQGSLLHLISSPRNKNERASIFLPIILASPPSSTHHWQPKHTWKHRNHCNSYVSPPRLQIFIAKFTSTSSSTYGPTTIETKTTIFRSPWPW